MSSKGLFWGWNSGDLKYHLKLLKKEIDEAVAGDKKRKKLVVARQAAKMATQAEILDLSNQIKERDSGDLMTVYTKDYNDADSTIFS